MSVGRVVRHRVPPAAQAGPRNVNSSVSKVFNLLPKCGPRVFVDSDHVGPTALPSVGVGQVNLGSLVRQHVNARRRASVKVYDLLEPIRRTPPGIAKVQLGSVAALTPPDHPMMCEFDSFL